MLNPRSQKRVVVVLCVVLGIALVVTAVGPAVLQ